MELCQPQSLENESMENESMENVALPTQILTEMSEIAVNSSLLPNNSNIGDLNLNLICAAVSPKSSSSDNSMSGKSEGESEKTTALLVGKRRRSQPIKFQPSPIIKRLSFKLRTPRTLPPRTTSTDDLTPVVKRKRGARCGNCPGCVREDCGKCDFCKDKPKFGGPGKKKQRCKLRTCSNFQHKKAGFYDLRKVRSSPVIRPSPEAVLENIPPFTKNKVASPTDSNNSSSTQSVESPLVSKDAVEVAKSLNVKQALSSNQLSYTKAVMQIAVTSQSSKLERDKSPSSKLSTLSSAVTRTIPTLTTPSIGSSVSIQVKPATPLGVLKLTTSVAPKPVQTDVTTASTAPISTSMSVGKKDLDALLVTLNSGNKSMPKTATSKVPFLDSSPKVESPKSAIKKSFESGDRMICIQCGRGRNTNISRNSKFCTQRCIIKWMEANPNKVPKEAVGDKSFEEVAAPTTSSPTTSFPTTSFPTTSSPTTSSPTTYSPLPPSINLRPFSSSEKTVPRALKKLQINMAKPGTKLNISSDSSDSNSSSPGKKSANTTPTAAATRGTSSFINSLATMITQTQKQMTTSKAVAPPLVTTPGTINTAGKKNLEPEKTSTPMAKGAAKRVATSQLSLSFAKKAKITTKTSTQGTPKSVSFNLKPEESATAKESSASMPSSSSVIPLTLDKIASFLQQPKKTYDATKVKIPPGLPNDVCQWTVMHVVNYFKSTTDCQEYVELFEAQEVDGVALLLLTHETLVKCLGIKLGRALKIMNRVTDLKRYHDHKTNK